MLRCAYVTLLAVVFLCGNLLSAPAPLPKKGKKVEGPNPPKWCGVWILSWHGSLYRYDFAINGTYAHVRFCPNDPDYSGKWRVEKDVLIVTEYLYNNFILEHRLYWDGAKWAERCSPTQTAPATELRR